MLFTEVGATVLGAALESAGMQASELDRIVFASAAGGDWISPATANAIALSDSAAPGFLRHGDETAAVELRYHDRLPTEQRVADPRVEFIIPKVSGKPRFGIPHRRIVFTLGVTENRAQVNSGEADPRCCRHSSTM